MGVTAFPIFNLYNIPEALRKVANDMDANKGWGVVRSVLVVENEDGSTSYYVFGAEPFTRGHAIGLLEHAKLKIAGAIE